MGAAVDPVAIEDVADGLDVATAMAGEAEHAEEEEEVPKLGRRLSRTPAVCGWNESPVRECRRKFCRAQEPVPMSLAA